MNIRPAIPEDKSAIIGLMKQSLGDSTIPKSEALWNWKHEANPFGNSYVLVAEEDNELIGLRAFMKWQWYWQGEIYKAIRAVDTATHPDHQGKGIFKKLTLQQLAICKDDGVHFVFNTPNEKSKPGYMKMGWQEQGKMPIKFAFKKPFQLAYNKFFNKNKFTLDGLDLTPAQEWSQDIIQLISETSYETTHISTILSPAYINWRYATNPLFRYNYFTDRENYILITRVKNQHFTKELRVVEFILLNKGTHLATISKKIKKEINQFCRENHVNSISLSGNQFNIYKKYFNWMKLVPVQSLGPIITLKDINMNDQFQQLLKAENWAYSLGDMELF